MQSVTETVKRVLKDLLNDIGYPVYNNFVSTANEGNAYILISDIITTDASPKDKSSVQTSIQITVYTKDYIANNDQICGAIVAGIYQRLFPKNNAKLNLGDEFYNFDITFQSETPQTLSTNNFVFINRILIFRLSIYQR